MTFAIVGAGFSGAVLARQFAEAGFSSHVFDSRPHVAGNSHTERDSSGVMVHTYGPHIFHTPHERVWEFINRFGKMMPYTHRVRANVGDKQYSLPVNLTTINDFFGRNFNSEEAQQFIASQADSSIESPVTFVDQAMKFVGRELYEAFFAGYTEKQWGVKPEQLPASILARLPVRFNSDDSYFNHPYQAIPEDGYTPIVTAMLDHPLIQVSLSTHFDSTNSIDYEHKFWSGPIDAYFDFELGHLGYRTLDFQKEVHEGDYQGCPVVNYCDVEVPFTRITEHKFFAPWETHNSTVIYKEFSRLCEGNDIPYYPIRLVNEKEILHKYVERAKASRGVTFLGRLGTYRYLDMDATILEALQTADQALDLIRNNEVMPSFFTNPLDS